MAGSASYDPNDPSTWGPVVGLDANKQPVYLNQPGTTSQGLGGQTIYTPTPVAYGPDGGPIPQSGPGGMVYKSADGSLVNADGTPFVSNGKTSAGTLSGVAGKAASTEASLVSGTSGSGSQTQLAKDVTASSTANAQAIYQQALDNSNAARTNQGPAALNAAAYRDTTDTQAYATNAEPNIQSYQAALAQAANATGLQQQGIVTDVGYVPQADVGTVNTRVEAPQIGAAAQTGAVNVNKVTVDPLANELRGKEIAAAEGIANGPSAAMSQFQAGQTQVVKDQLAMAAQARGSERAGLRREAIINAGAGGAAANLSAAALASQEQQAKNVAAASALAGIRTQDVTSATNAATIASQQANLQAQIDAATAQGNTAAVNALKAQQATLNEQASAASVQAGLSQQSTQAGLATANLTAKQQTAAANAAAANKSATDYAAAVNAAASQDAQNQTAVSLANAGATTGASKDYAGALNTAAENYAGANTATSQANAALRVQQGTGNATRALAADTTSAANQIATTQTQNQGANAALTTATGANTTQATNAQTIVDANKAQSSATAQQNAALISAGGAIIGAGITAAATPAASGAAASDERVKTGIKKVPDAQLSDLAKHVNAYTFHYKPGVPGTDGGAVEHTSQMAQELERSALGKKFVSTRPDGVKQVDIMGLASAMAAASALSMRRQKGASARA